MQARRTKEESLYKVSIHKNGGYMETARLHCPLLNYLYRHKFTNFVV